MSHINSIMNQLLTLIPRHQFESAVSQYSGNYYTKTFNCWNQLTVMLYAQISGKNSLRDIENSFSIHRSNMYHLGLNSIHRSTLADANQSRNYAIYENLFYRIFERCKNVTPKHKFRFKNPLYILDSTTIDLCLSLFPWAKFRTTKGAIKLHCQLDYSGQIPSFAVITDGKQHDIKVARKIFMPVADSITCFDKGYIDFKWFYSLEKEHGYFVTRAKDNLKYEIIGQQDTNNKKGVLKDTIIKLTGYYQNKDYPDNLRLIEYYDEETDILYYFLTNNFKLSAFTIALIYKARWQIEIFFKWIKQNLKIKTFLGTSKNAVLTQVWTAMCYYLLLSYIKYQTKFKHGLSVLHKLIQETLLNRLCLIDLLHLTEKTLPKIRAPEQLNLALNF